MIMPNPFFPSFNPMRNYRNIHNSTNNYQTRPQNHYSPSTNLNGYKNSTYNNNPESKDLGSNSYTFTNIFDTKNIKDNVKQSEQFFEIFGIKLYFDDLLIIALLFFLYKEECSDDSLFIILVLLLLS